MSFSLLLVPLSVPYLIMEEMAIRVKLTIVTEVVVKRLLAEDPIRWSMLSIYFSVLTLK